ncbi:MAG: CZB domain-containing protein [Nitrosomonadales bacterium]|nr:CZB domain-containing protein [Nitrosomonadales bacterium]
MALFEGLFSSEKKREINEEINLMEAVQAHISWKLRLQNCLDGTSDEVIDPNVVCRDDQCKLGKWIHGPAQKHFSGDETFRSLCEDHAMFHYVTAEIVRRVRDKDDDSAHALLQGEYKKVSRKVVMTLGELNKALAS